MINTFLTGKAQAVEANYIQLFAFENELIKTATCNLNLPNYI